MNKYLFENKEKKKFIDCSDEEKLLIVNNIEYLQFCIGTGSNGDSVWEAKHQGIISIHVVYRVLSPKPVSNKIDWAQVPEVYRYCFTNSNGEGLATEKIPVERNLSSLTTLEYSLHGERIFIDEGDYGFKRGTVESIDSLLIRPIGE